MEKLAINKDVEVAGKVSHGFKTNATGQHSHSEGARTTAVGDYSHAEGYFSDLQWVNDLEWTGELDGTQYKVTTSKEFDFDIKGVLVSKGKNDCSVISYTYSKPNSAYTINLDKTLMSSEEFFETYDPVDPCEEVTTVTFTGVIFKVGSVGKGSHREGKSYNVTGDFSHGEGVFTSAIGEGSHAEGYNTKSEGKYSHTEGVGTTAIFDNQLVIGKHNDEYEDSLLTIGNGTEEEKSNALWVKENGVTWSKNDVIASGTSYEDTPYKLSDIHSILDSDWGTVG